MHAQRRHDVFAFAGFERPNAVDELLETAPRQQHLFLDATLVINYQLNLTLQRGHFRFQLVNVRVEHARRLVVQLLLLGVGVLRDDALDVLCAVHGVIALLVQLVRQLVETGQLVGFPVALRLRELGLEVTESTTTRDRIEYVRV